MLQGITGSTYSVQPQRQDTQISEQQGEELSKVLEEYDASSLSDEDAKSLVSEIKELGIRAGSDLSNALSEAGVDANELAEQAGVGKSEEGRPPPPPPGGGQGGGGSQSESSTDDAAVFLIADVVAAYEETASEEGTLWDVLQPALEDAGYDTTKPVFDFYA